MKELTSKELDLVNGGGLTLVEVLLYAGSLVLSSSVGGGLITAAVIVMTEYQDYKNGV